MQICHFCASNRDSPHLIFDENRCIYRNQTPVYKCSKINELEKQIKTKQKGEREETRLDWVRLTAVPSSQATASNDFRSKSSNSSARSFCEISAEVEDMFMVTSGRHRCCNRRQNEMVSQIISCQNGVVVDLRQFL